MNRLGWYRGRAVILAGLILMPLAGCGEDDEVGQRYPVKGVVTFEGQPLKTGSVSFLPEGAGGRSAGADIGSDGSFSATTVTPGDGMLPGKYKVSINAVEVDMSKVIGNMGGQYRTDLISKAPKKRHVPKLYASPNTSGLSFEVKPEPNTYNISLTGSLDEPEEPKGKSKSGSARKR